MNDSVYVFKVALRGDKDTWRRIAIRGKQTLDDLHEAIFDAFDRDDEHLYSFYFPPPGSRKRDPRDDAEEYTHPEAANEPDPFDDKMPNNARKAKVGNLGLKSFRKFFYLFDFGDEWWHEITVEQTNAPDDGGKYPRIIEKKGDSPPQYENSDFDEEHEEDEEE